jgi:uncharacterized protein (DUF4415 family)
MPRKNVKSSDASTVSKNLASDDWIDPDDAPEITDEMLDRAEIRHGDVVIRVGRPPLGERAKRLVSVRLDADVLEAYKALGRGWQTQLNADLRRVRKLKKAG